jgi:hypothetical protein
LRAALALWLWAAPLAAEDITPTDYAELRARATGLVRFDALPPRAEPGHALDHGLAFPGGRIGTGFLGQTRTAEGPFDRLAGQPLAPLTLVTGPAGEGLSLAHHNGFGSMALFPLGPAGFPALEARGEGSIAVLFAEDTCAVGLLVHTDYVSALGPAPATGTITVTAYARDGALLGRVVAHPGPGVSAHAVEVTGGFARIAGLTLENDDPGGIAVDDLAFGPCAQILG